MKKCLVCGKETALRFRDFKDPRRDGFYCEEHLPPDAQRLNRAMRRRLREKKIK
jgi:hypothetical protein